MIKYEAECRDASLEPYPYATFLSTEKKACVVKKYQFRDCEITEWYDIDGNFCRVVKVGDSMMVR